MALVIGNSTYQHAVALPNPEKDAKAVAAMFQKSGFEVVTAEYDVGIVAFKRAVRQFEKAASDSDIAVVYFSGHGVDVQGDNYLVPVDAMMASDQDAEDEAVSLERLVEAVDGAKDLRIVILDACRDRPFQISARHEERVAALRGSGSGLSAAEPTTINTLIAYAAKPGTVAGDGDGEHSPFTAALLDNLFVPGLDIRLAFGRVRDEVLKKTGNRQEPFVYGSLGGGNISVVPMSTQNAEVGGDERDYHLVERINSARAWQVFINQHPSGAFADMARAQLAKLTAAETATDAPAQAAATPAPEKPAAPETPQQQASPAPKEQAAETPRPPAPPAAATKEQVVASIDHANPAPDLNSHDRVRLAQQELARLGCYTEVVDGSLGPATSAAVQGYQSARGAKPMGDIQITDDFLSDLKKQASRVCPLTCPAGKTAQGDQCVASQKPSAPAHPEAQASAAPARPALIKQQSASNAARVGIGVGF